MGSNRNAFETWWYDIGSGVCPEEGDDMESHARRVAQMAWDAGLIDAKNKAETKEA
jgi:hypothetical protein